jgi:hypothetical protein
MTLPEYLDQMSSNRERFQRAVAMATVTPDAVEMLESLLQSASADGPSGPRLRLLVITEDWCGTSLAYVPPVAKLVDGRPDVEMRIFLRDRNPDLMDQFLKHGRYRSIPVFAFFDGRMTELARFLERPPA